MMEQVADENGPKRYRVAPARPPPRYQEQIRLLKRSEETSRSRVTGGFIHGNNSSKASLRLHTAQIRCYGSCSAR
ncbi:hypothetical protein SRHO_G00223410 [Serrasalmus rhombeus]